MHHRVLVLGLLTFVACAAGSAGGDATELPESEDLGSQRCRCEPGSACFGDQCVCEGAPFVEVCCGSAVCQTNPCGHSAVARNCAAGCADAECLPCIPTCSDRECGSDGCGGSCGECLEGTACAAWHCTDPVAVPPFGPLGRISVLVTPPDLDTARGTCPDIDGDGVGDSSLVNLAPQLNAPIADALSNGRLDILFEFGSAASPVSDFAETPWFDLKGLFARPDSSRPGVHVVDGASYQDDGTAGIRYAGSRISTGELHAGPATITLRFRLDDVPLSVRFHEARLEGILEPGSSAAGGVQLRSGVFSGLLPKAEFDSILTALENECDAQLAEEKSSWCQYLTTVSSARALLFTLHDNGDGTFVRKSARVPGDTAAWCFAMALSPVLAAEPGPDLGGPLWSTEGWSPGCSCNLRGDPPPYAGSAAGVASLLFLAVVAARIVGRLRLPPRPGKRAATRPGGRDSPA